MTYKFEHGRIYLDFPYNKKIVGIIKANFINPNFNGKTKQWGCDENKVNLSALELLVTDYGFREYNEDTSEITKRLKQIKLYKQHHLDKVTEMVNKLPLKLKPRQYQLEGITTMLLKKKVLNGDQMGTGKTSTVVVAAEIANLFPILVVAPASVKYNWEKEWNKWIGGRSISVIDSKQIDFSTDVVIINYDILKKHEKAIKKIKWKAITADESVFLKNRKSIRTKTFKRISKKIEYIWLLSGTAISNRPKEIIEPLKILGYYNPVFGGWEEFVFRYCAAYYGDYGLDINGASNTLDLNEKLRRCCYIRRETEDVIKELPPYIENFIEVPYDNKNKHAKAVKDLYGYILSEKGEDAAERSLDAPYLILVNVLKQLSIESKYKYIVNWLNDFKETGEKLVVFGEHIKPLEDLASHFKCKVINGKTSNKNKLKYVEDFISNDDSFLFGNIQSLGTGVDGLQNISNNILFIELSVVPSDLSQAIARLKRSGQKNVTNVHYMFSKNSVDETIYNTVTDKLAVINAVNKGEYAENEKYEDINKIIYDKMIGIEIGNDKIN